MSPHHAGAGEHARASEPSHVEIIRRIDQFALEARTAHAEFKGAVTSRMDSIDKEIGYVRGRVDETCLDVAALKAASAEREGGGDPPVHDGGLPFKHGWRSWIALSALAVATLGGIAAAFREAGAFLLNLSHLFNSPPSS